MVAGQCSTTELASQFKTTPSKSRKVILQDWDVQSFLVDTILVLTLDSSRFCWAATMMKAMVPFASPLDSALIGLCLNMSHLLHVVILSVRWQSKFLEDHKISMFNHVLTSGGHSTVTKYRYGVTYICLQSSVFTTGVVAYHGSEVPMILGSHPFLQQHKQPQQV